MVRFGRTALRSALLLAAVLLGAPPRVVADVTVTTDVDEDSNNSVCSLREAIVAANTDTNYNGCVRSDTAVDAISFAIGTGTPSIAVGSSLPALTAPTTIDGATGGATRVEIAGGGLLDTGLAFGGGNATGSAVRNLVINGFTGRSLFLSNGTGIVVEGNYLGLDPGGTFRKHNSGIGIDVCAGFGCGTSSGHQIGGPTLAQRNVIASGSSGAIVLLGSGVAIRGNFINTNAAGTARLAGTSVSGIVLNNVANTVIGGDDPGEGNLIVGLNGVVLTGNPAGPRTSNTIIQGNLIGTDATGTASLQEGGATGIAIAHTDDTLIGGLTAGAGNLISGSQDGIAGGSSGVNGNVADDTTVQGNRIGTDLAGTGPLGNTGRGIALGDDAVIENNLIAFNGGNGIETGCGGCIQTYSENDIHSNGGLGIDLGANGPTDNDAVPGDPDTGPNGLQNFPELDDPVFPGGATTTGTLSSTPGRTFRIEVFSNASCDASLRGEGQTFVGAVDTGVTDGNGDVTFLVTFVQTLPATLLTATATDLTTGATSELSSCPVAPVPTATATASPTPTATPTGGIDPTPTPTATATAPIGGIPLGHFLGFSAKTAKTGPKFFKLGPVVLSDGAAGYTAGFDVVKPTLLAYAANKNGEGFTDVAAHLEGYAVKVAKNEPKPAARVDVGVTNQCGSLTLAVKKPVSLLVPTEIALAGAATAALDHFLCWQAKAQKKLASGTPVATLPKGVQVDVAVGAGQARRFDLTKVVSLCLPVAKSGTPALLAGPNKGTPFALEPAVVQDPASFLVCYQAKLASKTIAQNGCGPATPGDKGTKIVPKQAKAVPQLGVQVENQLGGGGRDVKKETIVCIPSAGS